MFLAFALVLLVACGGDAEEPTPTATSGADQAALPTVPPVESTPDSDVSEEEIAVITPEVPATVQVPESTPDATEPEEAGEVDSSPVSTPPDTVPPTETEETENGEEATPPSEEDATEPEAEEQAEEEEEPAEPTERARTGNETFDHPGDGTGGSGMPGERNSNVDEDDAPEASPAASPIAQLSISGCEVPDVPGFIGDANTFLLTADVNFRSGPGVDCDPLLDEPLGEGQTVEVVGGPVTQADDDTEWVQIELDGTPGWITTEFLDPVD